MKIQKRFIKHVLDANKSKIPRESSKLVKQEKKKNKGSLSVKRDFSKPMLASVQRRKRKKRKKRVLHRN